MAAALYKAGQVLKGRLSTYALIEEIYNTVWLASNGEKVIVKGVRHVRIENEREVLRKFQTKAAIRPLIDEIVKPEDPPGIVLRYLQTDLLEASKEKPLNRSEIKHVARTVLESLAVLHENDYIHTDIKPNNILCNFKQDAEIENDSSQFRISETLLADFGNCVPISCSYAQEGGAIGAAMFRSPEAILKLPWGTSTDIWSFGAMLISLFFGNYHIFKPGVSVDDPNYDVKVLQRMLIFFGPFPTTYQTLVDAESISCLVEVMNSVVDQRKPFHMAIDKQFEPADKDFIIKIMKLDPRYRPTAKELLREPCFVDS